jgi:ribosomal protein L29
MKMQELSEKSPQELQQLIMDEHTKLAQLAIDMRTKKVSNVKEIAARKKTIAQAMTLARLRELGGNGENNG